MNFKSAAAYKKWVAFGHATGVMSGKGRKKIVIKGKTHKVVHSTLKRSGRKPVKHH